MNNKVCVITGGSRGIGRAIWKHLDNDYSIVSVGRSKENHAICDLLDRDQRAGLIPLILDWYDQIDVLINNAGFQHIAPAATYDMGVWDDQLEMLTAAFDLSRRAREAGATRIINIASTAGIRGVRGGVGYAVAKAGLIHMTKCLSNEWAGEGVTVNCIAPGWIETDMLEGCFRDAAHKEQVMKYIPAGRIGTVKDILPVIDFLLEADYVTGAVIPVDGGFIAR